VTVATELCHTELAYTGVETTFPAGYSAQSATAVFVTYRDVNGNITTLTPGINVTVQVDPASGAVTVMAVGGGMPAAPGTVIIDRVTPGVQATNFANLGAYSALTHQQLHDAAAMRDDENKYRVGRAILLPSNENANATWPAKSIRQGAGAGTLAGFDANGNPVVYSVATPPGYVLVPANALYNLQPETAIATPLAVGATDLLWLINVQAATINLPALNSRNGLPLRLVDLWGTANAGATQAHPHSVVPNGADLIENVNAPWAIAADGASLLLTPNKPDNTATNWVVL